MLLYSVFDKKGKYFTSPFFARSDAEAVRSFSRIANDDRTDINQFPDDFALYCNGEFHSDIGTFSGSDPVKLVDASLLIKTDKTE